ncbi:MAG TPA: crosslink repair DNA glycosylase YcaQ family protein [Ktedonobacteraceae bacterium]|nr:crosslink repair DNA glycosylase YcaQ family protein [Ktedonobacteraceae bacterium]
MAKILSKSGKVTTAIHISREQAQRFLATYHFRPTDVAGVIDRLRTVQYDPLNPVGRNSDLVFQARVPGYQVDDWQKAAYSDRLVYDAWDKMACLVPVSDWPKRALIRERYRPYHDDEILVNDTEVAASILAAIDAQGPLSSLEFEDKVRIVPAGSWSGLTRTKRAIRAMWVSGLLVTHHRQSGRHYYDRPERIIPPEHFQAAPLLDVEAYHRWIVEQRHYAAGLLHAVGDASIRSAYGSAAEGNLAREQLVESGVLTPVQVGEKQWPYYMPTSLLGLLDAPLPEPRVIFLGPLDSLLWDRRAVRQVFDFDYVWEVYKPEKLRKWGYYVLPVFYGDRFIARVDSRLEKGIWTISRWWWEPDISLDADLLDALRVAIENFLYYLRADGIHLAEGVDMAVREIVLGSLRA